MTVEPIVELAVIVALMLFVYRGGIGSARALWTGWRGVAMEDPIWLALFAALVVLFGLALVFLVNNAPALR